VPRTGAVSVSPSALRFIDPEDLRALVVASGFEVTGWFGDWDRSEVADDSPEVVVLARRV
jgi:hypothetical protein